MFNKLISIFNVKLQDKCSETEISELANTVLEQLSESNINAILNENEFIQFLNGKNELILVNIKEVLYVYERSKNVYSFATLQNEYELLNKSIDIAYIVNDDFVQLDKKVLVNLKSVKWYNSYMGVVYFGDVKDQKTKKLQVSIKAVNEIVKKVVGKEKDLDLTKNTDAIYAPINKRKTIFQ